MMKFDGQVLIIGYGSVARCTLPILLKHVKIPYGNITIIDVAQAAGVSYATVSRVLNNDAHVKPDTRDRVIRSITRLGYTVNQQARTLAGGHSHVVGLVVPDLGTGYIGEIIRGIDEELSAAQYDLMLYTTHRRAAKEAHYIATLTQGMADGLLIVLPRNPANFMQTLRQRDYPYVLIDHRGTNEHDHAVGATNWQGAFNATEYLIKLGHERIGFITGSMDLGCARDRLAGYQARELLPPDRFVLVQHPEHVLGVGHDVGRRDVPEGADVLGDGPDPAPAQPFLLPLAEVVRVADDAALAAAERDVHDGALPGHPHGESAHRVDGLERMETDAAFARTAGIVVLDAEAAEDLDGATAPLFNARMKRFHTSRRSFLKTCSAAAAAVAAARA